MPEEPSPEAPDLSDIPSVADEREFFAEVGGAITDWAAIDHLLFRIFNSVLKAEMRHAAVIYYRVNTLSGRISLVSDMLATILPPPNPPNKATPNPVSVAWRGLSNDMNKALAVRNQLAHSPAGAMGETGRKPDGTFGVTDVWWGSYMSHTEKLRGKERDEKELRIHDVRKHRRAVGQFWMRLRAFQLALSALPPESHAPDPPRPIPQSQ